MKKACSYCGKVHNTNYICNSKKDKFIKGRSSKADKFRSSSAWQHKRSEIKKRDLYLCQVCMRSVGLNINPYSNKIISVHHIIGLQQNFNKRLDDDNLITLCEYHHKLADMGKISVEELLKVAEEQNSPPR